MKPLGVRRLEKVAAWVPPIGVEWRAFIKDDNVSLLMRAGKLTREHFVLGDPDEEEFWAATSVAEELRASWERSLIQGHEPPVECEEPWPTNLAGSIAHLAENARHWRLPSPIHARAISLLVGIEADEVPPPRITRHSVTVVRFTWQRANKCVSIEVKDSRTIEILNWTDQQLVVKEVFTSKFVDHVRNSIGWIYPEYNAADPYQFA